MTKRLFAALSAWLLGSALVMGGDLPDASASETSGRGDGLVLPPLVRNQPSTSGGAAGSSGFVPLKATPEAGNNERRDFALDEIADPWNGQGRFHFSADYLLWWVRGGPINTPLLTTGSGGMPPGALGEKDTVVLFGNNMHYNPFSGLRLSADVGLAPGLALEGGYFGLERRSVHFHAAASGANDGPVITRPFFNDQTGLEDTLATTVPGLLAGSTDIVSHTNLHGYEFNLLGNVGRSDSYKLDVLAGFRSLSLNEDLLIQDAVTPLVVGALTFLGPTNVVIPPSYVTDFDHFHTRNNFYGGQLGIRGQQFVGPWSIALSGKVSLGATQELTTIDGATTLHTPGLAPITAPGGVLAQTSNIGRYYRSVFSVVPEAGVNLGWQITPRLNAVVGYTFLYWSNVARPGNQIDPTINPALPPTDQVFGNGLGSPRPQFTFHSSDFWAQGINFGVIYRY